MPGSGGKPGRSRAWSPDTRAEALRVYAADGLAAAHKATGVPKGTITGWAKAAGVDLAEVAAAALARTEAATRERDRIIEERRGLLMERLSKTALDAQEVEALAIATMKAAITEAAGVGDDGTIGLTDVTKGQLAALAAGPKLREVVAVRTRSVHDLQVLQGRTTGESGDTRIVFATVALTEATSRPAPDVMELEVVSSDHLDV